MWTDIVGVLWRVGIRWLSKW